MLVIPIVVNVRAEEATTREAALITLKRIGRLVIGL